MLYAICVLQVIFETSRLATIVNGVLRKTTHDMELNGGFLHERAYFYVSNSFVFMFMGSRRCF